MGSAMDEKRVMQAKINRTAKQKPSKIVKTIEGEGDEDDSADDGDVADNEGETAVEGRDRTRPLTSSSAAFAPTTPFPLRW